MIKHVVKTLRNIIRHPYAKERLTSSILRYISWQVLAPSSKFKIYIWQKSIKVNVRRGMTGFTGNIYCEFYEYEDMMLLRDNSTEFQHFIDVGANVGAYSLHVLNLNPYKKVTSFEPLESNFKILANNIRLNNWNDRWEGIQKCVGKEAGKVQFTSTLDTKNKVIFDAFNKVKSVEVEQLALDDLDLSSSTYMKIDVEGYEYFVLQGAKKMLKNKFLRLVIIETVNDDIENAFILAGFSKRYYDVNNRELVKIKPKNYFTKNTIFCRC